MKKIVAMLAALALVFVLALAPAEANSFREVKAVNASTLVVKAGPSQSAATISTLKRGAFVTVVSTTNGWAYMQSGNVKGYVNGSYLTTPKSNIKIASSKSGLVVKESPTKAAKTVATLKYNMIVEDFGSVGGGWSFVQYGNVTGYVASSFIGTAKTKAQYTNDEIGIRNIASPSGQIIGKVSEGVKVTVHSTLAGWSYITVGAQRGYVQAAKLTTPKTITTAYAKDYLPNCSKTYQYKSEYDYETDYNTYYCSFYEGGRLLENPYSYDYSSIFGHFTLTSKGEMEIGYYEGRDLYKFPLRVGKSWTASTYVESYTTYYVQSLNEIVTTSAGTFFNVIKIRETTSDGYVVYVYFAPGVGILKTESSYASTELYSYY